MSDQEGSVAAPVSQSEEQAIPTSVDAKPPMASPTISYFEIFSDGSDVTFFFSGKTYKKSRQNEVFVTQEIISTISMSHNTAKDLLFVLQNTISDFEKQFGEIPNIRPKK